MSALTWKVTAAGRAALVNAQNTGTLPLRITHVGITEQAFTANADGLDLVLPGELKRLTTFAGDAVAADTIHVSITDDSADSYTLRGFALYFDTGVLFGIYGQAEPILEKSSQAMMLLAFDAIFADIDATSLSFGDTNFALPPATTTRTGIVELATVPEAITGTDSTRAITPSAHKAVLDDRLGIGAPSGFVKGLLTQATAALFRAALALKGAALKDEGAGQGLDADLLDGQHGSYYREYANLTGVPATFAPAAHGHVASDITTGVLGVSHGGTGAATLVAGNYLVGNDTAAIGVKTPAQVLADIGAAAVAHSHPISEVNALQAALAGKAASSHTHSINDVDHLSGGADWARLSQYPSNNDLGFSYRIFSGSGGGYWTWNGAIIFNVDAAGNQVLAGSCDTSRVYVHSAGEAGIELLSTAGGRNIRVIQSSAGNVGFYDAAAANYLLKFSPNNAATFSGPVSSPTAAPGSNTNQLATTAFVKEAISTALKAYLPKSNPTFTGTMTGPAYNKP